MSRPVVTYPDAERVTVDLLAALLAAYEPDVTVGVSLPDGWNADESDPCVLVACDGTPSMEHPIVAHASMRIIAWSSSTSRSKELAMLAHGLLAAHGGGDGIACITPLTGLLPARDPDHRAELASCTMRVTLRSVPVA